MINKTLHSKLTGTPIGTGMNLGRECSTCTTSGTCYHYIAN